ncbi:MAG: glycoside hydrolase family 127 protein [Verrucomicrobia bacterium]|nr:glycoside hydrolase family 127 protein [Verrucomicrobiota bacterium]
MTPPESADGEGWRVRLWRGARYHQRLVVRSPSALAFGQAPQPAAGAVKAGAFFALTREWKPGDEVALDLPMSWRLIKGRQRQSGRVALMRGPQVFCLNPAQNPALAKLDGTELGYLAIDPASLDTPIRSDAARPGGLACKVSFWKPGFGLANKADYELTLTEFPDPEGKATYFRLRDISAAVEDELLAGRDR